MKYLRRALYAALVALFVLRNDLWLWHDGRVFFGLPMGLLYHVLFCAGVVVVMALLVRVVGLSVEGEDSENRHP